MTTAKADTKPKSGAPKKASPPRAVVATPKKTEASAGGVGVSPSPTPPVAVVVTKGKTPTPIKKRKVKALATHRVTYGKGNIYDLVKGESITLPEHVADKVVKAGWALG